jgi:hypothetical protein
VVSDDAVEVPVSLIGRHSIACALPNHLSLTFCQRLKGWSSGMPFAVKFEVTLPDGTPEDDQKMLDDMIVPMAKQQAGFVRGVWMRKVSSPREGVGLVVFGTEQEAKDASTALRPPPGGPEVKSADIYEVGALA